MSYDFGVLPSFFGASVAALGIVGVALLRYFRRDEYAGMKLPPGDQGLPFLGHLLEMARFGPVALYDGRPPVHQIRLFGVRIVCIADPDVAEKIFAGEGTLIERNVSFLPAAQDLLGRNSLVQVEGPAHKRLRKQLAPAFSAKCLNRAFSAMQPLLKRRLHMWEQDGGFDGRMGTRAVSADFGGAFLGVDDIDAQGGDRLMGIVGELSKGLPALRINVPGFQYHKSWKAREEFLNDFVRPMIKDRRVNKRTGDDASGDMISLLLEAVDENKKILPEQTLEDSMTTLLFGAVDTTATAMMYFVYEMCMHPDIQERLRSEILTVFDSFGGEPDDEVTFDHITEMTYLEQVIRELSRRHVTMPSPMLRRAKDDFELNGYMVPKGWGVRISSVHLSLHPSRFKDPLKFDPERFATKDSEGHRNSKILTEFGFGSCGCMGKRLADRDRKLFAVQLLRKYRIAFAAKEPPTFTTYFPMQRTNGNFRVTMTPIDE